MIARRADAIEIGRQATPVAPIAAVRMPQPAHVVPVQEVPRWIREWSAFERQLRDLRRELAR